MQNEKYFYRHCNEFEYNHDDTLLYEYIYISMYMCESNFLGFIQIKHNLCLQTKKLHLFCSSSVIFFICLTILDSSIRLVYSS